MFYIHLIKRALGVSCLLVGLNAWANDQGQASVQQSEQETQISAKASQENQASLEVLEFVLASKVEGREPQEIVDNFTTQDRAFAFARLNVKDPGDVTFVWYRNGHEYTRFKSPVQASKKWRTFSSVTLRPGDWKVELVADNGAVLSEKSFKIE